MKLLSWISSAAIILTYILGTQVFADGPPEIVINEIAWAGSFASSSDEWIELYNPGSEATDISGWQITKNTGSESLMIMIPPASTIAADGYFLISNFDAAGSILAAEPEMVEPAITLSNTQLQLKLYKGDFNDPSNLIDAAGDGGVPVAGNNTTKSSMERTADFGGWQDSTSQTNLDAGAQELATPGAANSAESLPPILTMIRPGAVEEGDELMVDEISGSGFMEGLELALKRDGQSIVGSDVHVASDTLIDSAKFITDGVAAGKWDLVLTNPDGLQATLPEAINITEAPPEYDLSTTVKINEVYPVPESGQEEFIELYNFGSKSVNLMGWQLDDIPNGGSAPYTIPSLTILPNKFLVISKTQSHVTLNDTGDSVSLIQPSGFELSKSVYTQTTKGSSWSWFENENKWTTTPTPNGINVFTQKVEKPEEPVVEEDEEPTHEYRPGDIILNELLPNPDEADEFIELQNHSSGTIDLKGWYLKDGSGKKYILGDHTQLQPSQLIVIYADVSGIALNNSGGEQVSLFDPTGQLISTAKYLDKAPVNVAYAFDAKNWVWTAQATPGQSNQIEIDEIEDTLVLAESIEEAEVLPVTGAGRFPVNRIFFVVFGALGILSWHRYAKKNKNN